MASCSPSFRFFAGSQDDRDPEVVALVDAVEQQVSGEQTPEQTPGLPLLR